MNVLFIGDIVGRPGREAVKILLPQLKKEFMQKLEIKLVDVDFFDFLRGLYYGGFMFAKSYPRISKIGVHLMKSDSDELRHRVTEETMDMAMEYYGVLLDKGIAEGAIRKDINKEFIIYMMLHIFLTVTEYYFKKYDADDYDDENHELMKLIDQMIDLFKHGIST